MKGSDKTMNPAAGLRLFLIVCCLFFAACVSQQQILEAQRAGLALDSKLYEPYEKRDTIEGYKEFIKNYPNNVYIDRAQKNVERLQKGAEFADCDTAECLRDFLARYPTGEFSQEAATRLQGLDVETFDEELKGEHGFDLLLYRLSLKRLRQELIEGGKQGLGDFDSAFSLETMEGKRYFCTSLTFHDHSVTSKAVSEEMADEMFDYILSGGLEYLNVKFKKKQKINGFSFELASSDPGSDRKKVFLAFYFPLNEVDLFVTGKLEKQALLKKCIIAAPNPRQPRIKLDASLGPDKQLTKPVPMKWTSPADGLAKDGKFVRTALPAFSFDYPRQWTNNKEGLKDGQIFSKQHINGTPSVTVEILQGQVPNDPVALLTMAEGYATLITKAMENNGYDVIVEYVKPIDFYKGYQAHEIAVGWKLRLPGMWKIPRMLTYLNAIVHGEYLVIFTGTLFKEDFEVAGRALRKGDIDDLKNIYKTLSFASVPALSKVKKEEPSPTDNGNMKIAASTIDERKDTITRTLPLPLIPWSSEEDGRAKDGRFVRTSPPAFSFEYLKDWSIEGLGDKYIFNGRDPADSHCLRVTITKITGEESAFIKSVAEVHSRLLQESGSTANILYNQPADFYEGHRAYEFEIKYRPKGKRSMPVRTSYGNVIAKEGYAIILEGETSGDIDTLRALYETINLKLAVGSPEGAAKGK